MSHDAYKKITCRYCDAKLPPPFLELGTMPLANSLITPEEIKLPPFECPLSLTFCPKCTLVQLTHAVPADLMFKNYLYVSSTTKTFQDHFARYAQTVKRKLLSTGRKPVAVDIGSNDGLLVSCYTKEGMDALGVEPAVNLSADANRAGIKTLNRYFDQACVKTILTEHGPASVVSGNNVFAHIDDIQSVVRNVYDLLDTDGMFVIEFPYLVTMCKEMFFDMIYHEHVSYLSITALDYLFRRFKMRIFDLDYVPSHGGSCRVFIKKEHGKYPVAPIVSDYLSKEKASRYDHIQTYRDFASRVHAVKAEILGFIAEAKNHGKSLSGYGAPAKASTIIQFCGLTAAQIDFIIDDNPLKQNRLIPGPNIPIRPSAYLQTHPTDYILIFAWNFAKEIMNKIEFLKQKGVKFLIPLPKPTLV